MNTTRNTTKTTTAATSTTTTPNNEPYWICIYKFMSALSESTDTEWKILLS